MQALTETKRQDPPAEPGPWVNHTWQEVKPVAVAHIKVTGRPETLEGVLSVGVKPPADVRFDIVCKISPDMKLRDYQLIPCNACGVEKKFKHDGRLALWNGHLFTIGPNCGEHVLDNFTAAERAFQQSESQRRAEARLMGFVPSLDEWRATILRLLPRAEEADIARRRLLSRDTKNACRIAAGQTDSGGLRVVRLRSDGTGYEEYLGRLRGVEFIQSSWDLRRKLKDADAALSKLAPANWDETDMLHHLENIQQTPAIIELDKTIRKAIEDVTRVHKMLHAAALFLAADNWSLFQQWLSDPDCQVSNVNAQILAGDRRKIRATHRNADGFGFPKIAMGIPILPAVPTDGENTKA